MSSELDARRTSRAFVWYLVSSSLWIGGLSLENLLVTWLLVGELEASAAVYGESRALMTIPPLVLILIGGYWADRTNARNLLFAITVAAVFAPVALALFIGQINIYMVIAFGTSMALLNAIGDPARQALINRVTPTDIQRSIVIVTVLPSLVGLGAMRLGASMESLGISTVLYVLGAIFAVSAIALRGLPSFKPVQGNRAQPLLRGQLGLLKSYPLITRLLAMNFTSAIFNAGGYIVAMPLIARDIYGGDEALFAALMMMFLIGSTGSNVALYFLMPFRHPGKVFIGLQLTRAFIIVGIWLAPPQWLFLTLIMCWGVNMGVTSTVIRSTIQESAPAEHRAQLLSFHLFSFMLASPISATLLGWLIQLTTPLSGLLPGIPVSLAILCYGFFMSGYWEYESPSARTEQPISQDRSA